MRQIFDLLLILCLVTIVSFGCARLTTTYSTFKVQNNEFDKIHVLVDSAFHELGYNREDVARNPKKYWYHILGERNRFGVPVRYSFEVFYGSVDGSAAIRIENQKLGATQDELRKIKDRLSVVTSLIVSKFKAAKLNATVEIDSNWLPALGELP